MARGPFVSPNELETSPPNTRNHESSRLNFLGFLPVNVGNFIEYFALFQHYTNIIFSKSLLKKIFKI